MVAWLTENFKFMINIRDSALARFKKSRIRVHWDYYKQLKTLVKKEKKAYFQQRLTSVGKSRLFAELKTLGATGSVALLGNLNCPSSYNIRFF